MKNNKTVRLVSAITVLSAGMLSNIGSAQAVDLAKLFNSRFDFGSEGNAVFVNNVFDFTTSNTQPPTTSPGVKGEINITNATGGLYDLLSGGGDTVSGAGASILDIAFPGPLVDGEVATFPAIEGFYSDFIGADGKPVPIRFDLKEIEVSFNTINDVVNSVTFNLGGDLVDLEGSNSLANYIVEDPNKIGVSFNFTTITGQVPPDGQPETLPVVDISEVIAGDIPDLANFKPLLSTSYSGTVVVDSAKPIPEPMTMLGSAAAIAFGYVSKKRNASK